MLYTKQAISWPRLAVIPALIFSTVFILYILFPVTSSTDSRWTLYLGMSMLQEHDADLDEYKHLMEEGDYRVLYLNDHIYSYFPPGVPVAIVPFVWVVDIMYPLRYSNDFATYLHEHFPNETVAKVEKVAASFIAAVNAALMYLLACLSLDRRRAFLLTFVFAFATGMLSTASRALWQHGLSALCLTAVLWVIVSGRDGPLWMLLAGFLLGFSYIVRPTNSISIVMLTLFMLVNRRRSILLYLMALLITLMPFVWHSMQVFGTLLPPYYLPQRLGTNSHFVEALAGNLISPNRGLFISSPVLVFFLAGMYLQFKNGHFSLRDIEPYLAGILVLHWLAVSSFELWHGGWSLGARFFTDMLPYLVYFLIPVLGDESAWKSRSWRTVFVLTLLVSTLTHLRYATSIYPMMWNQKPAIIIDSPERIWSWRDLQVMRGLCEDKLEGPAPGCWLGDSQ